MKGCQLAKPPILIQVVIPAKAGIHILSIPDRPEQSRTMDFRLRGNDKIVEDPPALARRGRSAPLE